MIEDPARSVVLRITGAFIFLVLSGLVLAQILWGKPVAHYQRQDIHTFPPGWACAQNIGNRGPMCWRTTPSPPPPAHPRAGGDPS